jgi:Ca2+/H+ antiporter
MIFVADRPLLQEQQANHAWYLFAYGSFLTFRLKSHSQFIWNHLTAADRLQARPCTGPELIEIVAADKHQFAVGSR